MILILTMAWFLNVGWIPVVSAVQYSPTCTIVPVNAPPTAPPSTLPVYPAR